MVLHYDPIRGKISYVAASTNGLGPAQAGLRTALLGESGTRRSRELLIRRRAQREKAVTVAQDPPGHFLRLRKVKPRTRQLYEQSCAGFTSWARRQGLSLKADRLDLTLAKYVEDLYKQGHGIFRARMAVYGVAFVHALPTRDPTTLYLAKQQSTGWDAHAPSTSRDPMPEESMYLICDELLRVENVTRVSAAAALAVQYDGFCRPSETLSVSPGAVTRCSHASKKVALTLFPQDSEGLGPRSKGNEYDDTVIFGDAVSAKCGRQWVADILLELKKARKGRSKLLPITLRGYEQALSSVTAGLGLGGLKLTPHTARHGGPSTDYMMGNRSLEDIQRRGRWKTKSSVRRYEKSGKVLRQREKLGDALLRRAARARATLPGKLKSAIKRCLTPARP